MLPNLLICNLYFLTGDYNQGISLQYVIDSVSRLHKTPNQRVLTQIKVSPIEEKKPDQGKEQY